MSLSPVQLAGRGVWLRVTKARHCENTIKRVDEAILVMDCFISSIPSRLAMTVKTTGFENFIMEDI